MSSYKNIKVLIFGLGLNQGGVGSAKFFAKNGANVRVTDLKTKATLKSSLVQLKTFKNISDTLGGHKFEDIDWADLIIKNPAIKPGNPYIEYAISNGKRVEMDMGIFLKFVKPSQIIGITGTKGKSTTASLLYEILKNSQNIILAGNIGKSVLESISQITPQTLVILEISSFQLEAFDKHKVSPKWSVITNITPDHLNHHKGMDEYILSKRVIAKYQTRNDFLFIRKDDPILDKPNFLKGLKGKIIRFSKDDLPQNFHPALKGGHNLENIAAAFKVGKLFNINSNLLPRSGKLRLLKSLTSFKGIPFRMELIKTWHGVKIINDTCATSPESSTHAIKTFPGCILICGGMNKGMNYKKYANFISKNVKKIFFLEGDSTDLIRTYKPGLKLETFGPYDNLEKLLTDVKSIVHPGDTILFSPAATSFNLFQNEFDRGRKFNKAVEKLFR